MPSLIQTLEAARLPVPRALNENDASSRLPGPAVQVPEVRDVIPGQEMIGQEKVQATGQPRGWWIGPAIWIGLAGVAIYLMWRSYKKDEPKRNLLAEAGLSEKEQAAIQAELGDGEIEAVEEGG